jgi:hypothetical protein
MPATVVEAEVIEEVVWTACRAPSLHNSQPWQWVFTRFVSMANAVMGAGALWRTVCIGFAVIGLYLTYVGWMPAVRRPVPQVGSSTPDLPRAA